MIEQDSDHAACLGILGVIDQQACGNRLLRLMVPADFALLRPHLMRVPLALGAELAAAGGAIETACFLEGGVAAFLDALDDGRRLNVGLVGLEGMVGWPALMGNDRWPYDVEIRGSACTALSLDAGRLAMAVRHSPTLANLLLRFVGTFTAQMGRTIVSNLIHPVERRAARWILLYQDRLGGDEITLTHEEMSIMLGVRRASVTDALHQLEAQQAIRGLRGRVVIRDRAALEMIAGETYGFAEAEYERLIASVPPPRGELVIDPGS